MTKLTYHPAYSGVLPASESKIFDIIFEFYINNLYRRRFDQVYVYSEYAPGSLDTTVYFLNHYSWWDALTPYLLNKRLFKQNMRAMMVEHQVRKFPFFRKIGVFSVDKEHPRKSINSLRYAADSMFRDKASLYIYPQGKIEDEHIEALRFESGLIWLYQHLPDVHFVPIATTMNTRFSDKPRLYIRVGRRITLHQTTKDEIKLELEKSLDILRKEVQHVAEQEFPLWNRLL
jgi:1-acyl-sn-glycerol-3-phosphate acyltransferase